LHPKRSEQETINFHEATAVAR